MVFRILIFCCSIFFIHSVNGQNADVAIGQWRVHLSYQSVKTVETVGNKIYAASTTGLFYVDEDGNTTVLSKVDGFSDVGVSKLKYNSKNDILVIGYQNGNIDLLKGNEIININDILRKAITGSKSINHINFNQNFAYLSTDFGLVIVDLEKYEIKETILNLDPIGGSNKILSSTISDGNDSIFLATERGVMVAPLNSSVNLLDYYSWYTYKLSDNIPIANLQTVNCLNNIIYASVLNDGLYYLKNSKWAKAFTFPGPSAHITVNKSSGKLLLTMWDRVFAIENENTISQIYSVTSDANEAIFDAKGKLWVAVLNKGLLSNFQDNFVKSYVPNGPYSEKVFDLTSKNGKILCLAGGYNSSYQETNNLNGFYIFENNNWSNYNPYLQNIPYIQDFVCAAFDPHSDTIYFGTNGFGLYSWKDAIINRYTDLNSTLVTSLDNSPGSLFVRVTSLAYDQSNNLYVGNYSLPGHASLHKRSPKGVWTSYILDEIYGTPFKIVIDDYNNKWMITKHAGDKYGLSVFNETQTIPQRDFTEASGEGGLPSRQVYSLAKDKKGEIWIGTDKGVAVFYSPSQAFVSNVDFGKPIFAGFPLLIDEVITAIKVDGGNRKWIGTRNGLWLFNEDGTEVLLNFTASNSPLISNNILAIEINDLTGEVFIGTDLGIVSYRGTATEPDKKFSDVKVFPNPVKPQYNGVVGISGLAGTSLVKITDIYGNLVYETKAQGGMAVWNLKNYNGRKADTGVYLIFAATEDGTQSFVSKIAIVD